MIEALKDVVLYLLLSMEAQQTDRNATPHVLAAAAYHPESNPKSQREREAGMSDAAKMTVKMPVNLSPRTTGRTGRAAFL